MRKRERENIKKEIVQPWEGQQFPSSILMTASKWRTGFFSYTSLVGWLFFFSFFFRRLLLRNRSDGDVALHVKSEVVRSGEGPVAHLALEGPVSRVLPVVTGELVRPGKLPAAILPRALVRLLTCVRPQVGLQVRRFGVGLGASFVIARVSWEPLPPPGSPPPPFTSRRRRLSAELVDVAQLGWIFHPQCWMLTPDMNHQICYVIDDETDSHFQTSYLSGRSKSGEDGGVMTRWDCWCCMDSKLRSSGLRVVLAGGTCWDARAANASCSGLAGGVMVMDCCWWWWTSSFRLFVEHRMPVVR